MAWHRIITAVAVLFAHNGVVATEHWAFRPIGNAKPPVRNDGDWARTSVDHFILAKRQEAGCTPSPPADPRTLIRRMTFDLTGLPPTPVDVENFVREFGLDSTQALEHLIDRLLGSPHYGERWGRWWLDIARYADTNGQDENKVMANAWRYRDWVIRAFNANKPFDEFITEQLAGDLLPAASTEAVNFDRLIATGFLVLGPKMLAEQDKPKLVMDIVDEQIDTVGRAFLGLTLGCARCHDHKFDPVPAEDYYAMAGIFKSTRTMADLAFVSKFNEQVISTQEELAAIEAHNKRMLEQTNRISAFVKQANDAVLSGWKQDFARYVAAATNAPSAEIPCDLSTTLLAKLRDLIAPDPSTNTVSRALRALSENPMDASCFLIEVSASSKNSALHDALFGKGGFFALPKDVRSLYPERTRLELEKLEKERTLLEASAPPAAEHALAVTEDKPIDLPVHLRGSHLNLDKEPVPRGFIRAVSLRNTSFAIPPEKSGRLELARWLTHAENPLTARVIVNRLWQGHFGDGLVRTADNFGLRGEAPSHPELLNWLARRFIDCGWDVKAMHRIILRSAVYQQSSVVASGSTVDPENRFLSRFPRQRLEAEMVRDSLLAVAGRMDATMGGSLVAWKNNEYVPGDDVSAKSLRRTIYLPIVRDRVFDALTIFDFANPSVCSAKRTATVVSHQALFFLNSPLVKDPAQKIAKELCVRHDLDDSGRIREAYWRILNRPATQAEVDRALQFLAEVPPSAEPITNEEERRRDDFAAFCQTMLASNEFVYRY